jgi:hypothetical protein
VASPGGVEVSRASVRIVPDTSHLLADLKADLDKIERELTLDIKASVDTTELAASAREAVAEAQAAAGDLDIKARVDTSQVSQAESVLKRATSNATGLVGSLAGLAGVAALLTPALIPLVAVVGGLVAALAAPLAVVAGGVTIFGFLSGFAASSTLEQIKAIDKAAARVATLKKGTQEYADAVADLKAKQDALTPAQKAFASALNGLKSAINDPKLSGALLKPLTAFLGLLADILPKLTPVIDAVSGVFVDLIGDLDDVVKSPGFKKFVQAFAHDLGRDLRSLATIVGSIFIGLGGLFGALDDSLSQGVLKSLETLTGKFADFGKKAKDNKGLKSFVGYVKQNMPKVGDLIGNTFGVLGDALKELAPLGSTVLDFLNGILGAFQKLGDAAGPLAAALALGGVAAFFGGPEIGLAVGSVVALAAGFKRLYEKSSDFRDIIHDVGDYFTKTWLPKIKDAAQDVIPALKGAFKDVSDTIRDNKGLFEVFGKALAAIISVTAIATIEQFALGVRAIGKAFKFGTAGVKFFANQTIDFLQFALRGVKEFIKIAIGQFGILVDGAAAAFGWLPKIGGKVKAAKDAFHNFTDSVIGNIDDADRNLQKLQDQINEVGRSHPKFHIDSNTLQVISQMHQLNALKLQDKHLKITAQIEQQIERVTAPGGGMQRPAGLGSGNGGSGGGASGRGAINIGTVVATSADDIRRQAEKESRRRSGGGVVLAGAH